jgi:hypothetical protein
MLLLTGLKCDAANSLKLPPQRFYPATRMLLPAFHPKPCGRLKPFQIRMQRQSDFGLRVWAAGFEEIC